MKTLVGSFVLVIAATSSLFARSAVVHQSILPEPGLLALLGSGLVGLASLLRRYLSD